MGGLGVQSLPFSRIGLPIKRHKKAFVKREVVTKLDSSVDCVILELSRELSVYKIHRSV
jgi:hypothetical protein